MGGLAVASKRDIYGLPEPGASYKLNLRNYGSNYVGIRAITSASLCERISVALLRHSRSLR